jgi:hypothetical protein
VACVGAGKGSGNSAMSELLAMHLHIQEVCSSARMGNGSADM